MGKILEFKEFVEQMRANSKSYLTDAKENGDLITMLGYVGLQLTNLNEILIYGISKWLETQKKE